MRHKTKTYTSLEIKDNKPLQNTLVHYCSYCNKIALEEIDFDEYTDCTFWYCDCDKAINESMYKQELEYIQMDFDNKVKRLKKKYNMGGG